MSLNKDLVKTEKTMNKLKFLTTEKTEKTEEKTYKVNLLIFFCN